MHCRQWCKLFYLHQKVNISIVLWKNKIKYFLSLKKNIFIFFLTKKNIPTLHLEKPYGIHAWSNWQNTVFKCLAHRSTNVIDISCHYHDDRWHIEQVNMVNFGVRKMAFQNIIKLCFVKKSCDHAFTVLWVKCKPSHLSL